MVVGSHQLLMEALVDLLAEEPGLRLVAETRDSLQAIALAKALTPEVLLVDVEAMGTGTALIVGEVNRHAPSTRLVALSSYHDVASVRRTLDAGFHHHVSKSSSIDELLTVLLEDHVCIAQ